MMGTVLAVYLLSGLVALGTGKVVTDKIYTVAHARHDQQRAFNNWSKKMADAGFVRIPAVLDYLAFDDILEFTAEALDFAEELLKHPELLEQEFAQLFARQLAKKVSDPKELAWIEAVVAKAKAPAAQLLPAA